MMLLNVLIGLSKKSIQGLNQTKHYLLCISNDYNKSKLMQGNPIYVNDGIFIYVIFYQLVKDNISSFLLCIARN